MNIITTREEISYIRKYDGAGLTTFTDLEFDIGDYPDLDSFVADLLATYNVSSAIVPDEAEWEAYEIYVGRTEAYSINDIQPEGMSFWKNYAASGYDQTYDPDIIQLDAVFNVSTDIATLVALLP